MAATLINPFEAAVILLRLIDIRNEGKSPATRVRLSELTLKKLWERDVLTREFVADVQEWLYRAGWTLFYARNTYAAIRTNAVMGWPRVSSKRMSKDLDAIKNGIFDFEKFSDRFELENDADSD